MAVRTLRPLILTTLLLAGNFGAAQAEPIPAPKEALKDYHGLGFVQLEIPLSSGVAADGKKVQDVPFMTWFPFRQGYVAPDRMLMVMNVAGSVQALLATADTERVYNPAVGYVVQRTYKHLDPAANPMLSAQFSMATYARVLRELTSGKLLPAENLDQQKQKLTARIEELRLLREKLTKSTDAADLPRTNAAAAEQARLRNDLQQIDIRKAHPCHVVEFPNRDLISSLFTRGLIGDASTDILLKGKTTVWLTKAEGLPIKIEITSNEGKTAIFWCFTELRINQGLHPGELVLGAPQGTRLVVASADLREKNWEEKMDKSITLQLEAIEKERQASTAPPPRAPRKRK